MELKTTADRREYLYAQAWVDEPASGMDVINLLSDLTTALARVEVLEEDGAMLFGELENTEKQLKECQGFIEDLFNGAQKRFPSEYEAVDDDECECSAEDFYEHVIDAAMANKSERIEELEQQLAASQRQVAKMAREMVSCGCPGCPLELTCECQGGAGVDCVAKVEEWAKGDI